tara:strand:- start:1079 stop:2338 length:1260 start_codon:yes stop_codon:yes gene_type:complete
MKPYRDKKILLIEPPFFNLFGYERFAYPVTLTLVGTLLKEMGNEVKVYDGDLPLEDTKQLTRQEVIDNYKLYKDTLKTHPIWADIKRTIEEFKPDVVGLTAVSAKMASADKIAQMCRDMDFPIEIILGGPHVEGMLKSYPGHKFENYDYIIPDIPHLVEREPDKTLLINYEKYSDKNFASILTSTGCPSRCSFCCNSHERSMIYRSLESIESELQKIKHDTVDVMDDDFFANYPRFREIGKLFKKYNKKFSACSRILSLTPMKIKEYMDNGGERLQIGIESGSQRVLDKIRKEVTVQQIIDRTKMVNDAGLGWTGFMIADFPFENIEDLKLSKKMALQIKPTFISLNKFSPYIGTEIWNEYYLDCEDQDFISSFQLRTSDPITEKDFFMEQMFKDFDEYNKMRNEEKKTNEEKEILVEN